MAEDLRTTSGLHQQLKPEPPSPAPSPPQAEPPTRSGCNSSNSSPTACGHAFLGSRKKGKGYTPIYSPFQPSSSLSSIVAMQERNVTTENKEVEQQHYAHKVGEEVNQPARSDSADKQEPNISLVLFPSNLQVSQLQLPQFQLVQFGDQQFLIPQQNVDNSAGQTSQTPFALSVPYAVTPVPVARQLPVSTSVVQQSNKDEDDDPPLYVNPKQYHRILQRRVARVKLEASRRILPRKKYVHESRHLHAVKRIRGENGRFNPRASTKVAVKLEKVNSDQLQHLNTKLTKPPKPSAAETMRTAPTGTGMPSSPKSVEGDLRKEY